MLLKDASWFWGQKCIYIFLSKIMLEYIFNVINKHGSKCSHPLNFFWSICPHSMLGKTIKIQHQIPYKFWHSLKYCLWWTLQLYLIFLTLTSAFICRVPLMRQSLVWISSLLHTYWNPWAAFSVGLSLSKSDSLVIKADIDDSTAGRKDGEPVGK